MLLWLVWIDDADRPRMLAAVLLWWAWEEAQALLCSIAYAVQPWTVPVGASICSAKAGFDLGAAGIIIIAVLAYMLTRPMSSVRTDR